MSNAHAHHTMPTHHLCCLTWHLSPPPFRVPLPPPHTLSPLRVTRAVSHRVVTLLCPSPRAVCYQQELSLGSESASHSAKQHGFVRSLVQAKAKARYCVTHLGVPACLDAESMGAELTVLGTFTLTGLAFSLAMFMRGVLGRGAAVVSMRSIA